MEDLLPIEIEAMKNHIEDCLDHARETREEFDKVNKTISIHFKFPQGCGTKLNLETDIKILSDMYDKETKL